MASIGSESCASAPVPLMWTRSKIRSGETRTRTGTLDPTDHGPPVDGNSRRGAGDGAVRIDSTSQSVLSEFPTVDNDEDDLPILQLQHASFLRHSPHYTRTLSHYPL